MAVVGHWDTLAEAAKLGTSELLAGVVQTVIDTGHLVPKLPVKQINSKTLLYDREDSWSAESGAGFYDIREQIPWSSDVTYTQVEAQLYRIARQDPIDLFVQETYNNVNDYRAMMIQQLAKRMTRFLEHKIIYGDTTYTSSKEFDGLHAICEATNTGDLDKDQGGALSLMNVRKMLDAMHVDDSEDGRSNVFLLVPRTVLRRIDQGYQEAGFVSTSATVVPYTISYGKNDAGARQMFFDGVPMVPSSFLVAEDDGTGKGSNVRGRSSSAATYSIFGIRAGQTEDGGLALLFGGAGMDTGTLFKHKTFDVLENYDSGGERLVSYVGLTLGAGHSLGRIIDITDVAVVL